VEGHYQHGERNGKWVHFDDHGDTTNVINYIKGKPENENKLEKKETQEVLELEQNKGKFEDPRKMIYKQHRRKRRK
jgi:hypothetical protein